MLLPDWTCSSCGCIYLSVTVAAVESNQAYARLLSVLTLCVSSTC